MAARVKNWQRFQHFKDRRPPWVKLNRDLLDDPDWHELSGEEAKALVMIWLVASENDGNLPDNRKLAFRLRIDERQVETLLKYLSHWLDRDDSEGTDDAPPMEENTDVPLALHDIGRWRSATPSDGTSSDTEREYAAKVSQNAVRVTPGTPQWDAWLAHYATGNKLTHRLMSEAGDFNLHFLVPSEYPTSET